MKYVDLLKTVLTENVIQLSTGLPTKKLTGGSIVIDKRKYTIVGEDNLKYHPDATIMPFTERLIRMERNKKEYILQVGKKKYSVFLTSLAGTSTGKHKQNGVVSDINITV